MWKGTAKCKQFNRTRKSVGNVGDLEKEIGVAVAAGHLGKKKGKSLRKI